MFGSRKLVKKLQTDLQNAIAEKERLRSDLQNAITAEALDVEYEIWEATTKAAKPESYISIDAVGPDQSDLLNRILPGMREMRKLAGKSGLYFLYDSDKALIYVGKSRNLGQRIRSSASERQAVFFRYLLTNTLADMHFLEIYYINRYKPALNKDALSNDRLSFKILEPAIKGDLFYLRK